MLMSGDQHTRQNGMGIGTTLRAVAAIGFADDHGGAQHALSLIVGCLQLIHIQEAQQMRAVFAQAFGKTGVVAILEPALGSDQGIQASLQGLGTLVEGERIQAGFPGDPGFGLLPGV